MVQIYSSEGRSGSGGPKYAVHHRERCTSQLEKTGHIRVASNQTTGFSNINSRLERRKRIKWHANRKLTATICSVSGIREDGSSRNASRGADVEGFESLRTALGKSMKA